MVKEVKRNTSRADINPEGKNMLTGEPQYQELVPVTFGAGYLGYRAFDDQPRQ